MAEQPLDYFESKIEPKSKWLSYLNKVNYGIFPIIHLLVANYVGNQSYLWDLILIVPIYIVNVIIVFILVLVLSSLCSVVLEFLGVINYNLIKQTPNFRKWIISATFIANLVFMFFMYVFIIPNRI